MASERKRVVLGVVMVLMLVAASLVGLLTLPSEFSVLGGPCPNNRC
jgi:hypothetical protein